MSTSTRSQFLCGVVEGFYGRPWSPEQRFDLFMHMSAWGMNIYLYAPKDDDKHRAYWRDLYTLEEADHLSQLIQECTNRGVIFIYAIAPGLDITFSSSEDVKLLKRKLDQVVALGCKSFAVLFDDIESDMCPADEKVFPSFAHAQVTITNEMYTHLEHPQVFLFCPTEYCASRAIPSVSESQYLIHIGAELHPEVDVMWTGPKVISKLITVESIEELTKVIKRPPVIWDNLHANDYDQRRLFLGPYDGRSVALLHKLRGVLTNPNCEYGANYVPIHTLAQWSKCCEVLTKRASPTRQAMLLEMEGTPGIEGTKNLPGEILGNSEVHFYDPKQALMTSLKEWYSEFKTPRRKPEHYKPVKDATSIAKAIDAEQLGSDQDDTDTAGLLPSPPQVDGSLELKHEPCSTSADPFTFEDLCLMVDYFYLPHQHGDQALHVLKEFCWLKENAPGYGLLQMNEKLKSDSDVDSVRGAKCGVEKMEPSDGLRSDGETSESLLDEEMTFAEVSQWCDRAKKFHGLCNKVSEMYARLTAIPNRPLLYDLYQYSWDAKETTMLLDSYIAWLEAGGSDVNPEHEPHIPKGGITAEMQRLLPQVRGSKKLYGRGHTAPDNPSPVIYSIRPYRSEDKALVYQTCLETGNSGMDATTNFPDFPNMLGDRFVGPYTTLSPDLSFVLEDAQGVCGYMLATLDSEVFYKQFVSEWLPMIVNDYPSPPLAPKERKPTPEEELLEDLFHPNFFLPDRLQRDYPSHMHIDLMSRAQGQGVGTRMIKTLLATLKAKGSHGVHLEMSASNERAKLFYKKIGFKVLKFETDASGKGSLPEDVLVLGRQL